MYFHSPTFPPNDILEERNNEWPIIVSYSYIDWPKECTRASSSERFPSWISFLYCLASRCKRHFDSKYLTHILSSFPVLAGFRRKTCIKFCPTFANRHETIVVIRFIDLDTIPKVPTHLEFSYLFIYLYLSIRFFLRWCIVYTYNCTYVYMWGSV